MVDYHAFRVEDGLGKIASETKKLRKEVKLMNAKFDELLDLLREANAQKAAIEDMEK